LENDEQSHSYQFWNFHSFRFFFFFVKLQICL
jgi:hypothetical protein